ncbi:EamA family transporter [Hephaestia sp. GCM10023244]|uniref:DMT family transporter n=1 Tax=unclassified Hephaestia TaxID=2631281 RepID=UPI002076ECDA|nr:DMT family transporter [Hephaestia sp. MAHUQ-44]MCM8731036.1 DMT family transporter [Hephaestia sp. MAHUQ-44]
MSPLTLASILMIASGSIHAIVNAIVKGGRDKMAARALTDGSSAIILLPATLFVPWPTGAWGWIAASAVIHGFYLFALIRAYQIGDLSAVYPVMRGTAPLLTALVTLGLFGEPATAQEIAGIAIVGAAMFIMMGGRHVQPGALGWALLTGVFIASYTVIDAHGVRAAPTPASYIVWLFVTMGGVVVAMFGIVSRGAIFASAARQWKPGAIAGALSIVTYGMALWAFAMGPTALLAALRETGMVTALVISVLCLGERATPGRIAGVLGILAGAALILSG